MRNDTDTLEALMLRSDLFCCSVERKLAALPPCNAFEEARLKIGQCRGVLTRLQSLFEEDKLSIGNATVRAHTRHLIMAMMWVAHHARTVVDYKTFRMLVIIESTFTFLLITGPQGSDA